MVITSKKDGKIHNLDESKIDDYEEIDEDKQQTLIYCNTHKKYEWHWLPKRNYHML